MIALYVIGHTYVATVIATAGWKSFDIKTLADDAWDSRDGILTFVMFRKHEDDGDNAGEVAIDAKNRHPSDVAKPHHPRITYTLNSKTFEAVIQ